MANSKGIVYGAAKCGYKTTKDQQRQVAEAYLSGTDVFMSAPTGSGESFTFEIVPYAFDSSSSDLNGVIEDAGSV